jgi:hypothetical protein
MAKPSLLDRKFITTHITGKDYWSATHGSGQGLSYLGTGMLYYSIAYATRARVCVCLGSGGGFVPKLMRQAQRDLSLVGSCTFLVDGVDQVSPEKQKTWGTPEWSVDGSWETPGSWQSDVHIVKALTERAFHEYFVPRGITIDYLHIDADHHYEGVKIDWDLYSTLVNDDGLITLHDTTNYREPCGVPQLVEEIRRDGRYAVINFPVGYGTALVKKNPAGLRK